MQCWHVFLCNENALGSVRTNDFASPSAHSLHSLCVILEHSRSKATFSIVDGSLSINSRCQDTNGQLANNWNSMVEMSVNNRDEKQKMREKTCDRKQPNWKFLWLGKMQTESESARKAEICTERGTNNGRKRQGDRLGQLVQSAVFASWTTRIGEWAGPAACCGLVIRPGKIPWCNFWLIPKKYECMCSGKVSNSRDWCAGKCIQDGFFDQVSQLFTIKFSFKIFSDKCWQLNIFTHFEINFTSYIVPTLITTEYPPENSVYVDESNCTGKQSWNTGTKLWNFCRNSKTLRIMVFETKISSIFEVVVVKPKPTVVENTRREFFGTSFTNLRNMNQGEIKKPN